MSKVRETAKFLWDLIHNPPVEWRDALTDEVAATERWTRVERWHTFRPYWTHTVLTTKSACGCRRRFGMWHTIWCWDHSVGAFPESGDE